MSQQGQEGRFDDMYFQICQATGGINGLLDSLFNFMYRRTDFFYEAEPGDKMGFPPGQSANILISNYQKYQQEHYKSKVPKKDPKQFEEKVKAYKEKMQQQQLQQKQEEEQKQQQQKQISQQQQNQDKTQNKSKQESSQKSQSKTTEKSENKEQQKQKEENVSENQKEEVKIIKESEFNNTHNGGKTEKYSWSQIINEVTVEIPLPSNYNKKLLKVDLGTQNLKVEIQGELYVQGEFYMTIKSDDSFWNVEDGKKLVLTLEKAQEQIWKTVLKGDQEIDTSKVENTKPIESFDGETQGAIRKIMYDQQRKQMGLPTSEEESQMDMMKKAWDAEGSPFKGQPFDPSKLNFPKQGSDLDSVGGPGMK